MKVLPNIKLDGRTHRTIKPGTRYNVIVSKDIQSRLIKLGQKNHTSVSRIIEKLLEMALIGKEIIGESDLPGEK